MTRRRVVTGHDEQGKSVFIRDEQVEPVTVALLPGSEFLKVPQGDTTPILPTDGTEEHSGTFFPPAGGFSFGFVTMPPDTTEGAPADIDLVAALDEMQDKLAGLMELFEPGHPGTHTSATIDCGMVLAGTPVLELDDGATRQLAPGDTYVQSGTRHRRTNPGDVPVVLIAACIGAVDTGQP